MQNYNKSLANTGAAGTVLRCLRVDKMLRSRFLVLRSRLILSPPRHFQNNRGKRNGPGAGLTAKLREDLREGRFVCPEKKESGSRPTVPSWGGGTPGMGSWTRLWRPGAGRSSPAAAPGFWAALRPFLTFQREPAARVVLPRARPHHPGHSSGQCGHPGDSAAWKLYPGEGEIEGRERRW